MQEKQVSLYYSDPPSNKEYHAQLVASGEGFVVNFQYGRRGASLQHGSKTPSPVDYAAAEKIYSRLVSEKMSKGYSTGISGTPFQGTEKAGEKTDFAPQLCNAITEEEAERLLKDDLWAAQEKMNGERRAVEFVKGAVAGINRKGLRVPLPKPLADEVARIGARHGDFRADGEIIADVLHVFDLHLWEGTCLGKKVGWFTRQSVAEAAFEKCKYIRAVPASIGTAAKLALRDKIVAANGEGLVFKLKSGFVKTGKPNSKGEWLKHKYIESCSAIVESISKGKRSVGVALYDDGKLQTLVGVGNVAIPQNYQVPMAGDVVEVEYLYAYKGGSLYQPVYRGVRPDIDRGECVIGQLKYKPKQ